MSRDSLLSSLSNETDVEIPTCSTLLKSNNLESKTKQKILPNEPNKYPQFIRRYRPDTANWSKFADEVDSVLQKRT